MDATPRFLRLGEIAEILNVSDSQVYQLVRRNELKAIKIGQRGQWRVERSALEEYIQSRYDDTARFIEEHPLTAAEADLGSDGPER